MVPSFSEANCDWESAIGFGEVIVLAYIQTVFALDLSDKKAGHFQPVVFQNVRFDLGIGCFEFSRCDIQLIQVDLCRVIRDFSGQSDHRLNRNRNSVKLLRITNLP